jgi:hypothetical protein
MLKMEPHHIANSSKHTYLHLGNYTTLLLCKRETSEEPFQYKQTSVIMMRGLEGASTVVTDF